MTPDRPDDPERHREPTASDVDAAFAQIVARWDEEPPQWPADDQLAAATAVDAATEEIPALELPQPFDDADADDGVDDGVDDDHYVPPEPPPLPRPQPATVGAVLLFALGIVLLAFPNMIGMSDQYGLPLGLLSITGAIVWLVARLRQGPPTDSGWDDGAQL